MKIVFLSDDFPPTSFGGAGISTFELALGVQKAGHEVSVITTCRKESEAGESEYHGLKILKIASNYPERWRAWVSLYNPPVVRRVNEILKELRPDVVHANNIHFYLSYHCLKVAKRYAKAVVWTARDTMAFSYGKLNTVNYLERLDAQLTWYDNFQQAGKRYNPLRNFTIRKYLSYADKRLAVSSALSRALEQNSIHSVSVLRTGIDVSMWQASPDQIRQFKKKYGIGNKKIILFGGRLSSGVSVVRAMKLVVGKEPEALLLVIGREEDAKRMKNESGDLAVAYTGWISGEEKVAAYCVSDAVMVPSTYFDAFPRSVLEASAAGKPIIATKFGGAAELVQDGVTGYVVNPFNAQEIADKTLDLLQHTEKAEAFGRAGRERVKTDFSLDEYVAHYLSQYQALLG